MPAEYSFPDVDAATAALQSQFGPVTNVVQAGQGAWSRAFGFTHDGRELIARFGQHLDDFRADTVAAQLATPGLPIPKVHLLTEALDGHLVISDRCTGTFLEDLDAVGWQRIIPALFTALDELRAVPLPGGLQRAAMAAGTPGFTAHGLATPWPQTVQELPDDGPGERLAGWRARLAERPDAQRTTDHTLAALQSLAEPVTPHLIHADLINRNAMAEGDTITGIFDWGCVFAGDPLYDLAWLEFWQPWHPGLAQLDLRALALEHYDDIGVTVDNFDRRMRVCCLKIGLDHLVYNAFTGNDINLEGTRLRTVHYL